MFSGFKDEDIPIQLAVEEVIMDDEIEWRVNKPNKHSVEVIEIEEECPYKRAINTLQNNLDSLKKIISQPDKTQNIQFQISMIFADLVNFSDRLTEKMEYIGNDCNQPKEGTPVIISMPL